jgi:hypothetical protein
MQTIESPSLSTVNIAPEGDRSGKASSYMGCAHHPTVAKIDGRTAANNADVAKEGLARRGCRIGST